MTVANSSIHEVISAVTERARPGVAFSLLLDFDGTLVPISDDPAAPMLDNATQSTLASLSHGLCHVSIVSGRALDDLFPRIGLDGLLYAGNHGLEIRGLGWKFVEPAAVALRGSLDNISQKLAGALRSVAGAQVENKGLTASIHFRHVAASHTRFVEEAVRSAVASHGDVFRINTGKKVFEIVPRTKWHKGIAAQWINRHLGVDEYFSIYVGDDTTDEDAFSTLTRAITVDVGSPGATSARYHFEGPEEVHEFLDWMAAFVTRGV